MVASNYALLTEGADGKRDGTTFGVAQAPPNNASGSADQLKASFEYGHLPKLDALTSLRFFAAMMLVLFHADLFFNRNAFFKHFALKQGVCFFFVLSGFVLFYNYPRLVSKTEKAKFFIARFARIWPAQAAVLMIMLILLPAWSLGANGTTLVAMITSQLLMVQSCIPSSRFYLAINSPAWSISTEFCFYILFPLLIANWHKTWLFKLCGAGLLTVISIMAATYVASMVPYGVHKELCNYLVYISPLSRLLEFIIGMTTAFAFKAAQSALRLSNLKIGIMQSIALITVIAALFLCPLSPAEAAKPIASPIAAWVAGSGGCIAFAFLIFSMAFKSGFLARILCHPFLVLLGEISYSIYLLHWLLLVLLNLHITDKTIHLSRWEYIPGFVLVLFGTSYLMYRLVEKPCRKSLTETLDHLWDRLAA